MPCAVQIKKSPRPQQTLRIAPATHPRQFPSPRGNVGQLSRQVFWLMVHPTPRAFPSMNRTVAFTGFVPIYSGGTARDLHPLPLPRSHIVEGTLGDREEGCQGHYCPSPPGLLMQPPPTYEKAPDRQCGECRYDDGAHAWFEIRTPTVVALETKSTVTNDVNQTY